MGERGTYAAVDFQSEPINTDLLTEALTNAEVQMLLARLGSAEFGGSENATVGAVVEATGADAVTVGGLLADIRKGNIETILQGHESRIQNLEQSTSYVAYPRPPTNSLFIPFNYPKTDVDPMSESEVRRGRLHRFLVVFGAIVALPIFMYMQSCSR